MYAGHTKISCGICLFVTMIVQCWTSDKLPFRTGLRYVRGLHILTIASGWSRTWDKTLVDEFGCRLLCEFHKGFVTL